MLALLDGLSPWWWVAAAILLAAIEMVTPTTLTVWSAAAAFVTALVLWFVPGLGGAEQIALFALLSIAFTFAGRAYVVRHFQHSGATTLNRRAAQVVGREAVVVSFEHSEGQVTIDGMPWPARLEAGAAVPAPGARVRVSAVDGIVLRVQPI